jgi:hypothetical protein
MIYKQILLEEEEEEKVKVNIIGKNLNEKKNVLRQKRKEKERKTKSGMDVENARSGFVMMSDDDDVINYIRMWNV